MIFEFVIIMMGYRKCHLIVHQFITINLPVLTGDLTKKLVSKHCSVHTFNTDYFTMLLKVKISVATL